MYDIKPNLLIGFHGCEQETAKTLINNAHNYPISQKPYDWLGHGIYFWENNYDRALEWAKAKAETGAIKEPAVVGAIINLGYCCDLLEASYINLVSKYFKVMEGYYATIGQPMPVNKDLSKDPNGDKLLRHRDCAVIEFMHAKIFTAYKEEEKKQGFSGIKLFQSTRGVFTEGGAAFEGAGMFAKSHIQICIRDSNCIQGFFLPRETADFIGYLEKNTVALP